MSDYVKLGKAINALELDTVFRLTNGEVTVVRNISAPNVTNHSRDDIEVDGSWECITGMTGQYGYNGAVMHPSEFIGDGIAKLLHEMATKYPDLMFAIVPVWDSEANEDGWTDTIGWAIAYRDV